MSEKILDSAGAIHSYLNDDSDSNDGCQILSPAFAGDFLVQILM